MNELEKMALKLELLFENIENFASASFAGIQGNIDSRGNLSFFSEIGEFVVSEAYENEISFPYENDLLVEHGKAIKLVKESREPIPASHENEDYNAHYLLLEHEVTLYKSDCIFGTKIIKRYFAMDTLYTTFLFNHSEASKKWDIRIFIPDSTQSIFNSARFISEIHAEGATVEQVHACISMNDSNGQLKFKGSKKLYTHSKAAVEVLCQEINKNIYTPDYFTLQKH